MGLWTTIQRLELETFTQRDLHQHVRTLSVEDLREALNVLAEMGDVRTLPPAKATAPHSLALQKVRSDLLSSMPVRRPGSKTSVMR